jgi:hypothetical protein
VLVNSSSSDVEELDVVGVIVLVVVVIVIVTVADEVEVTVDRVVQVVEFHDLSKYGVGQPVVFAQVQERKAGSITYTSPVDTAAAVKE